MIVVHYFSFMMLSMVWKVQSRKSCFNSKKI